MNIRRIFSLLVAVVCVGACAFAQELNCEVEINSSKIQNANKEVFTTLQQTISEYMNTTKWTDAQFGNNEKNSVQIVFDGEHLRRWQWKDDRRLANPVATPGV